LEELRAAIANASWPRALELALAYWRATRAPGVADLVDAIDARCPRLEPPDRNPHAWWLAQAAVYDPHVVGSLVRCKLGRSWEHWSAVAARHPGSSLIAAIAAAVPRLSHVEASRIDQVAYMVAWPDDPRVSRTLAAWFVEGKLELPGLDVVYRRVAERLIEIGDARALPQFVGAIEQPRGPNDVVRYAQQHHARDLARRLASVPPDPAHEADVAACAAVLGATIVPQRSALDEAELWQAVAGDPDNLGARAVLADCLIERGDPRGELIAAQLSTERRAARRAGHLIAQHWYEWLGDLGLVITRRGSELRHGMLETIQVGMHQTPPWAYAAIRGHRELGTVRTVRAHYVAPEVFADLIAGLPNVPERVGIDAAEILELLAAHRRTWPIRALEYAHHSKYAVHRERWPSFGGMVDQIARTLPALEELRFDPRTPLVDVLDLAAHLETRLPTVRRLIVELTPYSDVRLVAGLSGLPHVVLVHT
jgi:uncharacterized protein (TIGR02996 family)